MRTSSKLPVLRRCPGMAVLPHHRSTSDAAEDGTRYHERYGPALVSGNLPDTPRGRALATLRLRVEGARCEVAYALDLGTGLGDMRARELHGKHHRDYSDARPGEICGTTDIVADDETGELKFGASPQEPPERNAQMWFGALARWGVEGRAARMRLVHVRPPDSSGRCRPWAPYHDPTLDDLARWRDELAATMTRVDRARAAWSAGDRELLDHLVLGDHCGRCDARLVCPAIGATITHDEPSAQLAQARAQKKRADLALARVEEVLAGADGLEGEGGRYQRTTTYRRQLDTASALDAVPDLIAITVPLLTVGALDEWAAAQEHLGATRRERVDALNQMLEESGALRWTSSSRLEEM